jgi:hypothetical protein
MAVARTTDIEPAVGPGAAEMNPTLMTESSSVVSPNPISPSGAGFATNVTASAT